MRLFRDGFQRVAESMFWNLKHRAGLSLAVLGRVKGSLVQGVGEMEAHVGPDVGLLLGRVVRGRLHDFM